MIVIVGESASGKSTLQNMFIRVNPEYKKVVTYTTRPMRSGEVDGVDYHFILKDQFDKLKNEGFFVEYNQYRDWMYGTAREDCSEENSVAVLNPPGMRALKRLGIKTLNVYLKVDRRSRMMTLLQRGDDIDEAYRRNLSDSGLFNGVDDEVDYIIDNAYYRLDKFDVLDCFTRIIEEYKNSG